MTVDRDWVSTNYPLYTIHYQLIFEVRKLAIYDFSAIEKKWQKYWEENKTFATDVWDFSKPKYYVLDMFPYPSGVHKLLNH